MTAVFKAASRRLAAELLRLRSATPAPDEIEDILSGAFETFALACAGQSAACATTDAQDIRLTADELDATIDALEDGLLEEERVHDLNAAIAKLRAARGAAMSALLDAADVAEQLIEPGVGAVSMSEEEAIRLLATHARESVERIERLTHEWNALGRGIAEAALKGGIYNGEVSLTGPDLLLLAEDMGSALERAHGAQAKELDAWKRTALLRATICSELRSLRFPSEVLDEEEAAEADLRALGIDPATGERIAVELR